MLAWPNQTFFAILANPVRRRILEWLLKRLYTVNNLVDEFELHRPSVSEHLQLLRRAKLVRSERRGHERYYHIEPSRLAEVGEGLKPSHSSATGESGCRLSMTL